MRRWNSWGNEDSEYTTQLSDSLREMLVALVGPSTPLPDASLEDTLAKVPASRLPAHPLVSVDPEIRLRHARGQSLPDWFAVRSGEFVAFPDGVAFPESAGEVGELLRYAADNAVSVIPYGGGTSVVGHINPELGERAVLTIDMGRMNQLIDLDKESQLATFGAGTPGPLLEEQLQREGYTLGHYPQSWELSTVGGWVASRSSGQQSLRYGRIEQLFAGGSIETPVGTLEIPTIPASSAGPDIREMILGSEGRMGIITEVKVRVSSLPECESFHVIFFPSWSEGMATAKQLAQQKMQLSMVRLSNQLETISLLHMGNDSAMVQELENFLSSKGIGEDKVMMTLGVTGTEAQCQAALEQSRACCAHNGGVEVDGSLGERWAHGRFRAPYLREPLGMAGYAVDTMETAIDWVRVPQAMADIENAIRTALADEDEQVHVYTHLSHVYGQGSSIYTTYLFRYADSYEATLQRWNKLKAADAQQIVAYGGPLVTNTG